MNQGALAQTVASSPLLRSLLLPSSYFSFFSILTSPHPFSPLTSSPSLFSPSLLSLSPTPLPLASGLSSFSFPSFPH